MVIKITNRYNNNLVDDFIKNNNDIVEKYQLRKIEEYDDCVVYEFSCDKVEDLFSIMRKLSKGNEEDFVPILYDKSIDLFFGYLEGI
jgi:bisphosphoglycerate-independent phosphoglycerate mutase (AlkP superfamily)